jgi:hypothetical protein
MQVIHSEARGGRGMDRLALGFNCWHYLNRDRFQYKNMELVKEIKVITRVLV